MAIRYAIIRSIKLLRTEYVLICYFYTSFPHRIRLFGAKKLKRLAIMTYHTASVNCLDFSSQSLLLAAGSKDKHISIWSVYDTVIDDLVANHASCKSFLPCWQPLYSAWSISSGTFRISYTWMSLALAEEEDIGWHKMEEDIGRKSGTLTGRGKMEENILER